MFRRKFILLATALAGVSTKLFAANEAGIKIHFLRHATFLLEFGGVRILVDPMLGAKGSMDPVGNAGNTFRIPMVDLPLKEDELKKKIAALDAVIVTHTHRDHWDAAAHSLLPKQIPLIIQPSDETSIRDKGFTNPIPVQSITEFNGLKISRTAGQHGSGDIGARMGKVSGFLIESGERRIYIAGDTIWCKEVENIITAYNPEYIVVNAGAAQFLQGGPITMNGDDVLKVCETSGPSAKVIAVHMETINHCVLKRNDLYDILKANKYSAKCTIPDDGQVLQY